MQHDVKNRNIILGLSGGVDSAVAAALLLDAGARVQALHMSNWHDEDGYCTAADDLQDARQVCDSLGIALHHVDFSSEYRDRVFRYFLDEYRAGRTPNPDVLCNREIKFGVFREYAKRLGADLLATGHYARTNRIDGVTALLKGLDTNKDQSYFLHAVSEAALAETVFPLGELPKSAVRDLAHERGLSVYAKKDSTGICFIGERPFREFLQNYLPANPGPIRTVSGNIVGEHHGLMYYTLGQRQGLGIGGRRDADDAPWYVVDKHLDDNALIVDQGDSSLLYSTSLLATMPVWIGDEPGIDDGLHCQAKVRYRQPDQACIVVRHHDGLAVSFETAQRAVAPGQYVVFYRGERCLGGAVIDRILTRPERREPTTSQAIA